MTELFKYFLYLGLTGFGGPISLIQQMRQYLVEKKEFMDGQHFDKAFTLIKAMPGPIAFQMAVYCGHCLKGRWGGFLVGLGLILPSFLMMIFIGIGYEFFHNNIFITALLNGFQFSVAAVILWSLKSFLTQSAEKIIFWILLFLAGILYFFNLLPEPVIILGFGAFVVTLSKVSKNKFYAISAISFISEPELLWKLFKICTYAGAVVFGTGLALLPVLQNQFVVKYHWLDLQTFNDGVTFGQMTPGPVTITSTFLGYKIAGFAGALVATIGVFIIPLFHMLTWFPKVFNWLSGQDWIDDFVVGASAAVVGVLIVTIYQLNRMFMSSSHFWIISLSALISLFLRPKTPIFFIIFAGGVINLVITFATMNPV